MQNEKPHDKEPTFSAIKIVVDSRCVAVSAVLHALCGWLGKCFWQAGRQFFVLNDIKGYCTECDLNAQRLHVHLVRQEVAR